MRRGVCVPPLPFCQYRRMRNYILVGGRVWGIHGLLGGACVRRELYIYQFVWTYTLLCIFDLRAMDNFDGFGAVQSFGSGVGTTGTWRTLPIVEAARRWTRGKEMILKFQGSTCRYSHNFRHAPTQSRRIGYPGGWRLQSRRTLSNHSVETRWTGNFLGIMDYQISKYPASTLKHDSDPLRHPSWIAFALEPSMLWQWSANLMEAIDLQTLRRPCAATAPFVGRIEPYNGTFGMESMMVVKIITGWSSRHRSDQLLWHFGAVFVLSIWHRLLINCALKQILRWKKLAPDAIIAMHSRPPSLSYQHDRRFHRNIESSVHYL